MKNSNNSHKSKFNFHSLISPPTIVFVSSYIIVPIILPLCLFHYVIYLSHLQGWKFLSILSLIDFSTYTFGDPASVYSYHLISFHDMIMQYMLFILVLVYWSLYKILKDYTWRRESALITRILYYTFKDYIGYQFIPNKVKWMYVPFRKRGVYHLNANYNFNRKERKPFTGENLSSGMKHIQNLFSSNSSIWYDISLILYHSAIFKWSTTFSVYSEKAARIDLIDLSFMENDSEQNLQINYGFEYYIYKAYHKFWHTFILGSSSIFSYQPIEKMLNISASQFPRVKKDKDDLIELPRIKYNLLKFPFNRILTLNGSWLFQNEIKSLGEEYFIDEGFDIAKAKADDDNIMDENELDRWVENIALSYYYKNNYISNALFYDNRFNNYRHTKRRSRVFHYISPFGMLEMFLKRCNITLLRRINTASVKNSHKFHMADTFFQSQRFKHSTAFEFIWATLPVYIIATILGPSFYLLYSLDDELDPDFVVKVIGHQWYWSYEFDNWVEMNTDIYDFVSFKYQSNFVSIDDLQIGTKRLLEVDKRLILPINVIIRFVITSSDVLHAWAVPALGIKSDAVPGRLNQFLAVITYPGVYYGQCSELCGAAHGFMPIVVQAVSYPVFLTWLKESNFC